MKLLKLFVKKIMIILSPILRTIIKYPVLRRIFNDIYLCLNWKMRHYVWRVYSKIFRTGTYNIIDGNWKTKFNGKQIIISLQTETIWLDWDLAVSICGHDSEVKMSYENFINSRQAPDLFVDIGANYGTHSLLFLTQGIDTISFEPNKLCHQKFIELCKLNNVTGNLKRFALGAKEEVVILEFLEKDTWSSSIRGNQVIKDSDRGNIISENVDQSTIDLSLESEKAEKILIKVDVEGSELSVFLGATKTFETKRPVVIFESHRADNNRNPIYEFFENMEYHLFELPFHPEIRSDPLSKRGFLNTEAHNHIAVPKI